MWSYRLNVTAETETHNRRQHAFQSSVVRFCWAFAVSCHPVWSSAAASSVHTSVKVRCAVLSETLLCTPSGYFTYCCLPQSSPAIFTQRAAARWIFALFQTIQETLEMVLWGGGGGVSLSDGHFELQPITRMPKCIGAAMWLANQIFVWRSSCKGVPNEVASECIIKSFVS